MYSFGGFAAVVSAAQHLPLPVHRPLTVAPVHELTAMQLPAFPLYGNVHAALPAGTTGDGGKYVVPAPAVGVAIAASPASQQYSGVYPVPQQVVAEAATLQQPLYVYAPYQQAALPVFPTLFGVQHCMSAAPAQRPAVDVPPQVAVLWHVPAIPPAVVQAFGAVEVHEELPDALVCPARQTEQSVSES